MSSPASACAGLPPPPLPVPVRSLSGSAPGFVFYTPLALSVSNSPRAIPKKVGIYVWTKRAFGDFAGFITAWTYWVCNLPYFPAVLYFAASNALYIRHDWGRLSNNTTYYIVFSLVALTLATLLNIVGLTWARGCITWARSPCGSPSGLSLRWARWPGIAMERPPRSRCTP